MTREETIFEKIITGEINCEKIYSDDICVAFNDINPQAPTHFLVIPKKHISDLKGIKYEDSHLLGHLIFVGAKIAQDMGLKDWRTVINTGDKAGQTVFHLHVHVIGGRDMNWPPG